MATRFGPTQLSIADGENTLADELHAVSGVGAATSNAAASPLVMTAAQMLSGVYIQTVAGAFALTLPTAASVVALLPNVQVGSQFVLYLINTGNNTLTLTAGTGNTLGGQTTATLATVTSNILVGKVTNATLTTEAITYHVLLKTAS